MILIIFSLKIININTFFVFTTERQKKSQKNKKEFVRKTQEKFF